MKEINNIDTFKNSIQLHWTKGGVLKKPRGRIFMYLWWEDKDRWFMNLAKGNKNNPTQPSVFITEKDLKDHLKSLYLKDDFKMFLLDE